MNAPVRSFRSNAQALATRQRSMNACTRCLPTPDSARAACSSNASKPARCRSTAPSPTIGSSVRAGDRVEMDSKRFVVVGDNAEHAQMLAYNKPEGVVATRDDPEGRPTMFEQLPMPEGRALGRGRSPGHQHDRAAAADDRRRSGQRADASALGNRARIHLPRAWRSTRRSAGELEARRRARRRSGAFRRHRGDQPRRQPFVVPRGDPRRPQP